MTIFLVTNIKRDTKAASWEEDEGPTSWKKKREQEGQGF